MRNSKIDLLRFIGLSMIIFAHIGSYGILFQIRNFDVPLMVLVSGMSFGISYKSNEKYFNYLWKRIKRLVFPVWIFLTIFFVILYVVDVNNKALNLRTMLTSYMLISGIGYVWIIKVFLLVALISPLLFKFHRKTKSNKYYFSCIILIYILYEVVRYFTLPYIQGGVGKGISYITHYIIPYGVIFAIGLRIPTLTGAQVKSLSIFSLISFIIIGVMLYSSTGHFVSTQSYKYPPSLYYFSYALFISCILWLFSESIESMIKKVKLEKIVAFMAQNSIWIYLWHIPAVSYFNSHYLLNYLMVIVFSTSITYIQVLLVKKIVEMIPSTPWKKNIKTLFTG